MSTTTINGTLNVTTRANAPTFGTTAGNMTLAPTGTTVTVASGKVLAADQLTSSTAATDLTLNATGANINCSNKTLINVGGIVSPAIQAVAAGPAASADATPVALLTLPVPANTCYLVTSEVVAVSPTGATTVDAAAWRDLIRVTNRAGVLTLTPMTNSVTQDAGLTAATVAYSASSANLVATVTGVAGLGIRWAARASFVSVAS